MLQLIKDHGMSDHEKKLKGRFVVKGNAKPEQRIPTCESGAASSSGERKSGVRTKRNYQQRLNLTPDEIEGLSAENKELYACLQYYTDSDSD
jgi:hypothetical protein